MDNAKRQQNPENLPRTAQASGVPWEQNQLKLSDPPVLPGILTPCVSTGARRQDGVRTVQVSARSICGKILLSTIDVNLNSNEPMIEKTQCQ